MTIAHSMSRWLSISIAALVSSPLTTGGAARLMCDSAPQAGTSVRKTVETVSSDGMPCGSSNARRSSVSFAAPNSGISTQVLARHCRRDGDEHDLGELVPGVGGARVIKYGEVGEHLEHRPPSWLGALSRIHDSPRRKRFSSGQTRFLCV